MCQAILGLWKIQGVMYPSRLHVRDSFPPGQAQDFQALSHVTSVSYHHDIPPGGCRYHQPSALPVRGRTRVQLRGCDWVILSLGDDLCWGDGVRSGVDVGRIC